MLRMYRIGHSNLWVTQVGFCKREMPNVGREFGVFFWHGYKPAHFCFSFEWDLFPLPRWIPLCVWLLGDWFGSPSHDHNTHQFEDYCQLKRPPTPERPRRRWRRNASDEAFPYGYTLILLTL